MNKLLLIFSALSAFTLFLAFLIGLIFIMALVIGGEVAAIISSYTLFLMNTSMYIATLAVFIGLIYIYIIKEHGLTFDIKK